MKRIICSVVGLCLLAGSGMATAQSLADTARKSQAQRKSTKRPARVYTNADVPVTAAATANTATEISSTPKEGEPANADPNAKPAEGSSNSVNATEEAAWRAKITSAREAVSRSKEQLEGMRTRVLHLQTAKALGSNGDVNNQAAVAAQQSAALQEFDRLRADVEKFQKALADVEAEARAKNVPAGWLR
jgi:hypothetical protein